MKIGNQKDSSGTYFLNLLMIKKIIPTIPNTSIIPAHNPTLNIPSITEHPEKINVVVDITIGYKRIFPMMFRIFSFLIIFRKLYFYYNYRLHPNIKWINRTKGWKKNYIFWVMWLKEITRQWLKRIFKSLMIDSRCS